MFIPNKKDADLYVLEQCFYKLSSLLTKVLPILYFAHPYAAPHYIVVFFPFNEICLSILQQVPIFEFINELINYCNRYSGNIYKSLSCKKYATR